MPQNPFLLATKTASAEVRHGDARDGGDGDARDGGDAGDGGAGDGGDAGDGCQ
jgi:hypothetical protein